MRTRGTDIRIREARLYFLPVETRVPLKFGPETLTRVTCARVCVKVENRLGQVAEGWGETPLSVQWVWPCELSYEVREDALKRFCKRIEEYLPKLPGYGHPMELGHLFLENVLPRFLEEFNRVNLLEEPVPYLAGLVCFSLFDIAIHDAYGNVNQVPVYNTYNEKYMNRDLAYYLEPASKSSKVFCGKYPGDYFKKPAEKELVAWHLVGGKDILRDDGTVKRPDDGYPFTLDEWIERDGLKCLKIKLTGTDPDWDYKRLTEVGEIGLSYDVDWFSADFNCQVTECDYVNDILDRLMAEHPRIYARILYIEQPFPYDLEKHEIDVRSVSARKPLFMDESAHDWRLVRLGRELGWSGVALKTCKTQTGALLSLCWAKAHGMTLMVQDLTNPMLAQIPHVLLASHAGTIMGVETNSMQFYPEVSGYEAKVHPGLYARRNGKIYLDSIKGNGFGYRIDEINRPIANL
ncbi:MAG: mandelate racemase/muconate lactonizing enzyme family protein [Clostridiaceae bacterium]|nr:mandelate racemase/muconate lactonizing enzyme family protein [Clostridiaceae bacterium]